MTDTYPDPMISTAALAARLGAPGLVLIDATWFMPGTPRDARTEHARQHVPGAVFFDIDEISDDEAARCRRTCCPRRRSSRRTRDAWA